MAQATDHCIKDLDDMYSSELKRWDMFASAPGPPAHLLYNSPPHSSKDYQQRGPSHMYATHTGDNPIPTQLKICSQETPRGQDDDEKKPFKCQLCNLSFKFQCHLTAHLLKHSGDKPFKCNQCNFSATQKGHLKTHMLKHSGGLPYACNACDYRAKRKDILEQHKMGHTGERPYSCLKCDCRFKRAYGLKKHMLTHSKLENENQLRCGKCNYWAKTKEILDVHKACHTIEKPLVCDQCGFRFRRLRDLNRHKLSHSDEKPFACDRCDIRTKRATDLKKHKLSYHTELNCPACPFVAKGKKDLKSHSLSEHSLGKSWICDVCQFSTSNKSHLKRHKLTMKCSREAPPVQQPAMPRLQPFACPDCPEVFGAVKDLNFHKMIHTLLPRTFQCHMCPDVFLVEEELGYHKLRHQTAMLYECNSCAFCSLDEGSLREHKLSCNDTNSLLTELLMCQGAQH